MEKERFIELMMEAEPKMFHIALSILRKEQNCSDAVQEAMVNLHYAQPAALAGRMAIHAMKVSDFHSKPSYQPC